MHIHPDSIGHNYTEQFPEIFRKFEPMRFLLPGKRMSDFFDSSSFLFGSLKTHDINMIFSAVQRLYGDKHKTFIDFLKSKCDKKYTELLKVEEPEKMLEKLDKLWKEYNSIYGMGKTISKFYIEWLTDEDKKAITSKMVLDAKYKPSKRIELNDRLKLRIDILIDWRNKLDHSAIYTPFSDGKKYLHCEITQESKRYTLLNKLAFKEFYELTRRAMSRFWLKEYENYLSHDGKEKIDKLVNEVSQQCIKLNKRRKKSNSIDS